MENVKVPSSKPYVNSYACRLTEPTFEAEITTSENFQFHIIENYRKKLVLLRALQFQFDSGTCPIRELLSLKLPMDSQCI